MKRVRLETISFAVTEAQRHANLVNRYGSPSVVRAPAPSRADDILAQIHALPPRSDEAVKLAFAWMAAVWPGAFGLGARFLKSGARRRPERLAAHGHPVEDDHPKRLPRGQGHHRSVGVSLA